MTIYKKGQGNKARAVAAIASVAIAAFGIGQGYNTIGTNPWFYVVAAVLVVGVAGTGIYLSLINPRTSEFLIETQAELKKVAWPPKNEVKGAAGVVVGTVIILGLFMFGVDTFLSFITTQILPIYR